MYGGFAYPQLPRNICRMLTLKINSPNQFLLLGAEFFDGLIQVPLTLCISNGLKYIHIGGKKAIVQIQGIQRTMSTGLSVVVVVLLPV